jgi:hypothetical protein
MSLEHLEAMVRLVDIFMTFVLSSLPMRIQRRYPYLDLPVGILNRTSGLPPPCTWSTWK